MDVGNHKRNSSCSDTENRSHDEVPKQLLVSDLHLVGDVMLLGDHIVEMVLERQVVGG